MKKIAVPTMLLVLLVMTVGCSVENGEILVPEGGDLKTDLAEKANHNPRVLPPHSNPHGQSYGEWSIDWWQWMTSSTLDENPGLDETGEFVSYGQSGSVWFLAPNYGGTTVRTASIPPGKALFINVMGFEASTREGHGETVEELVEVAAGVVSLFQNVQCIVDGVPVQEMEAYRVASPTAFSLTVPDDNVFDLWGVPTDAGTYYPSVAEGYYVMLAPLSAGEHVIQLLGGIPEWEFTQDITFNLTVTGRRGHGHGRAD